MGKNWHVDIFTIIS